MYMDDIMLFAKNEKELKTLIKAIRIYNQDIGMEFGIEKYAIFIMKVQKEKQWKELNNSKRESEC